jgi:hypothetical protein
MKAKQIALTLVILAALGFCLPVLAEQKTDLPKAKTVTETTINEYTIVPGDTLWGISEHYYGDPWLWPTIWELNPSVVDPHWIYPDNKLKVKVLQGTDYVWKSGSKQPQFLAPTDWWDPTFAYTTLSNRVDFISKSSFEKAGEIVDEIDDSLILGEYHTIFFTMPEETNVQLGDVFTVFREREKVESMTSGDNLGRVIDLVGAVTTTKSTTLKNGRVVYTGNISESLAEIKVGDRLISMPQESYTVTLNKTSLDLKGHVVAFEPDRRYYCQHDIVFIDLGLNNGVEIGNSFSIWRKSKDESRLPGYFIGNLIILHVEPTNATALVTNSLREMQVGDTIQSDIQ